MYKKRSNLRSTLGISSSEFCETQEHRSAPKASASPCAADRSAGGCDALQRNAGGLRWSAKSVKKNSGQHIIGRCLATAAVAALLMVLSGCSNGSSAGTSASQGGVLDQAGTAISNATGATVLGAEPFASMLWGEYMIDGVDTSSEEYTQAFLDGMKFDCVDPSGTGTAYDVSVLPVSISFSRFGGDPYAYPSQESLNAARDSAVAAQGESGLSYYNDLIDLLNMTYAQAELMDQDGRLLYVEGFCQVDGNTVSIYNYELDEDAAALTLGEKLIEFKFDFEGRNLILSSGGCKLEYVPASFSQKAASSNWMVSTSGYVKDDAHAYKDVIRIYYSSQLNSDLSPHFGVYFNDGDYAIDPVIDLAEDGTFSISWDERWKTGEKGVERIADPTEITGQYLWCGDYGLILIIDGEWYLYQYSEDEYLSSKLAKTAGEDLSEDQVSSLLQTQTSVLSELNAAFASAGINVLVDETSGKVTMDTGILFAVDDDALSDQGMSYLNDFLDVYASVILPYMQEGLVSEVQIEGHTDTSGSYEYNLDLSERRAASVAEYCLSRQPALSGAITTKGRSFSEAVYDASGSVDMAASRRVVFSFVLSAS